MKKIATILLEAILLTGCEKSFELHPEDYSDIIRLECVADATKDSVFIFPSICVPAHTKIRDNVVLDLTGLSIEVNGEERKAVMVDYTEWETPYPYVDENGEYIVPEPVPVVKHRFAVPGAVPEGASLKIKASAKGMEDVYGLAKVPVRPKLDISCTTYDFTDYGWGGSWTTHYLKFKFDIKDKENETGYYAVQILRKSHSYCEYTEEAKAEGNEDYDYVSIEGITPEDISESSFLEVEENDGITIGYDGYRLSYYWSGAMRLYTAEELENACLYVRVYPDSENNNNPYIIRSGSESMFKTVIFRVSPEIYRYSKAYTLEKNNDLAGMGLAPVNFTYSNIIGGSGYFGAMNCVEGEWMENPFKQENR